MDAFGGVPLFETHPTIFFQPPVDLWFPRVEFGRGLLAFHRRRAVIVLQHNLCCSLAIDSHSGGNFPGAVALPLQLLYLVNLVHSKHFLFPAGHPTGLSAGKLPSIIEGSFDDFSVHARLIFLGEFSLR